MARKKAIPIIKQCRACGADFEAFTGKPKSHCSVKCSHKTKPSRSKEAQRKASLRRAYGVSIEQWNEMFNSQNGCCAICHTHQSNFNKRLHVDHCHVTGRVRGLLCQKCNHGIGMFKDNKEMFLRAAEYVS